jgi:hypothetical protein
MRGAGAGAITVTSDKYGGVERVPDIAAAPLLGDAWSPTDVAGLFGRDEIRQHAFAAAVRGEFWLNRFTALLQIGVGPWRRCRMILSVLSESGSSVSYGQNFERSSVISPSIQSCR